MEILNNRPEIDISAIKASDCNPPVDSEESANNIDSDLNNDSGAINERWLKANKRVRDSGKCNADGLKIPVPSSWNIELFEFYLQDYHDKDIIKYFKFGWPIDLDRMEVNQETPINQKGARQNIDKLRSYVKNEIDKGSVIGPFDQNPFGADARISPVDAIPKKDSEELRIILNLSYPIKSGSVNAALDKNVYQGQKINLRYPGVDDMIRLIRKKGRGALLFKKDLKKFYRQIVMDPGVIHLLGFKIDNKYYFDVVLSMGLRIACYIGQRISDALMWIYRKLGFEGLNYLDDLGSAECASLATKACDTLSKMLEDLNVTEALDKATIPSEIMTFLGIRYNTRTFTIELTAERLAELKILLREWLNKSEAKLREVQALLGKLNFACATVRSGRAFLARIIAFIIQFKEDIHESLKIPEEVIRDLEWWAKFLMDFNGISFIPEVRWLPPDAMISTDSCLSACGGWNRGDYFHIKYPSEIVTDPDIHINELECLAVVVAVKVWGNSLKGKNILLHCDNSTTVTVVNKGYARNQFTQACLRELVWLSAKNNLWIKVAFRPGISNRFADLASRLHLNSHNLYTLKQETRQWGCRQYVVGEEVFKFLNNW